MIGWIKGVVKTGLPYPVFLRLYYAWYWATVLPRCVRARRKAGIPSVDKADFTAHKSSDVFFVLGSGPSINRISPQRWQVIGEHDSVGFNWWLIHPFVPKFYFLEVFAREAAPDHFDRYVELANYRAPEYAATIKVAMELQKPGTQNLEAFGPGFRQNLFAAYNLPAPARNEHELAYAARYLDRKGFFRPGTQSPFLMKYASSVTTMLMFALKCGYRTVVLCGIDLTTQEYFFQDPALYPEWADLEYAPRNSRHTTDVRLPWRVPVTNVIAEIKRQFYDPADIKLYVEHTGSALWPMLNEAPDSLFESTVLHSAPAH